MENGSTNAVSTAVFLLVLVLISGCAATVQQQATTSYVDNDFSPDALNRGRLAVLPVVAGQGVEGYRRPFGAAINETAIALMDQGSCMTWEETMDRLNDAGLVTEYNQAITSYRETAIIDKRLVERMGEAIGTRYLLFTQLGSPVADKDLRYSALTGGTYTQETMGVDAFAQVWDTTTGDVVWEGTGAASAQSGELSHLKETDIGAYSDMSAEALVHGLLGVPLPEKD